MKRIVFGFLFSVADGQCPLEPAEDIAKSELDE